jgi:hypothetical protein
MRSPPQDKRTAPLPIPSSPSTTHTPTRTSSSAPSKPIDISVWAQGRVADLRAGQRKDRSLDRRLRRSKKLRKKDVRNFRDCKELQGIVRSGRSGSGGMKGGGARERGRAILRLAFRFFVIYSSHIAKHKTQESPKEEEEPSVSHS